MSEATFRPKLIAKQFANAKIQPKALAKDPKPSAAATGAAGKRTRVQSPAPDKNTA